MTIKDELTRAEHSLDVLRHAAAGLRSHLGADLDVTRLTDDIARCCEDVARLRTHVPLPHQPTPADVIVIPDHDYDADLWAGLDVDAEGLGVPGRRAP
jgi:hypothetical protein